MRFSAISAAPTGKGASYWRFMFACWLTYTYFNRFPNKRQQKNDKKKCFFWSFPYFISNEFLLVYQEVYRAHVCEKEKEDVVRFGQNVHTTQTFSKKETLKRPVSSLEGSITKLLTPAITGQRKPQAVADRVNGDVIWNFLNLMVFLNQP